MQRRKGCLPVTAIDKWCNIDESVWWLIFLSFCLLFSESFTALAESSAALCFSSFLSLPSHTSCPWYQWDGEREKVSLASDALMNGCSSSNSNNNSTQTLKLLLARCDTTGDNTVADPSSTSHELVFSLSTDTSSNTYRIRRHQYQVVMLFLLLIYFSRVNKTFSRMKSGDLHS